MLAHHLNAPDGCNAVWCMECTLPGKPTSYRDVGAYIGEIAHPFSFRSCFSWLNRLDVGMGMPTYRGQAIKKQLTLKKNTYIEFCIQNKKYVYLVLKGAVTNMDSVKPISIVHKNLDQKAYQIIKKMINDRQLAPGDKISQEKLAAELGISRTPLISALKYLEKEKLVEAKPRRGFFVRAFSQSEMVSIFELREVLEGLAARRAAMTITADEIDRLRQYFKKFHSSEPVTDYRAYSLEDRRFHQFVTHIAAREFLESILSSYNIISFSYQHVSSEGLVRGPHETLEEHLAIIDAICSRDPVAAETKMRQHFQRSIVHLNREIKTDTLESQPQSKEVSGLKDDQITKKRKAVSG